MELMVFKLSTFWSSTSITHLIATWDLQGANACCARNTHIHNYITDQSFNKQIKLCNLIWVYGSTQNVTIV